MQVQVRTQAQRPGVAHGEQRLRDHQHPRAPHVRRALPPEHRAQGGTELQHGVRAAAVRAQVLDAREPLLQEAEQARVRLARVPRVRHGEVAATPEHEQGDEREGGQGQAGAPVLARQQRQHAHEQECAAEQLDHELGEEVGQRLRVAVDALDHLAGRAPVVERHVQAQAM